jgi:hypothetical protein
MFVVFRHLGSIGGVEAHKDVYIATADDDGRAICEIKRQRLRIQP